MTEYNLSQPYPVPPPLQQRPAGVTILAVLNALLGILLLLSAACILIALGLAGSQAFQEALAGEAPEWFLANLSLLLGAIGAISLIMGILAMALAYGFLNGKRWAWFLAILYGFLNVGFTAVTTLLNGGLIDILMLGFSILIPVLILVYLFQPKVKAWFAV